VQSYTAFTKILSKRKAEALGEAIETVSPTPVGIGVFKIEDGLNFWEVAGYYTEKPDEISLSLLGHAYGASPFIFSDIPERDWVAHVQRDLHPVSVGKFFVFGKHDKCKVPKKAVGLLIEASMAFGTGHHGTTRGCLLAINELIDENYSPEKVVDIGCGTAVLAMAAGKTWNCQIIATDIDPVAIEVTKTNLIANRLENKIICITADGIDNSKILEMAPFDLIFANILKGPILKMAGDLSQSCSLDGIIILSGILNEQSNEVLKLYKENKFVLINEISTEGWTTLKMRKVI
jgi:ribosomal protein L11 methyltransferase